MFLKLIGYIQSESGQCTSKCMIVNASCDEFTWKQTFNDVFDHVIFLYDIDITCYAVCSRFV